MQVALVGCRAVGTWPERGDGDHRPWERDDRPLVDALEARGATVHRPAWDDPNVDWARFDVALLRATWDYHHHRDAFVAWVEAAGARTRMWNPPDLVRWNTHKGYLRALDVPQPPTAWIDRADALEPALQARLSQGPAFLKPAVGATAEGTLRFEPDAAGLAAARDHVTAWLRRVDTMLLQPYVASVETAGERSAVVIDGRVTHWVRKIPVPGDYRVQDDYGASDEAHAPSPAEEALVRRVLAQPLPARALYARIDWILSDGGEPWLVELELTEPCLFFRHGVGAADVLAEALLRTAS